MVCSHPPLLSPITDPETGLNEGDYREPDGTSIGYASSRHTGSTRKSTFLATSSSSTRSESILRAPSSHAPSFHSAVETMSLDIPITASAESRAPLSPTATTPSSQSPRRQTPLRSRRESSDGQFSIGKSRSKVLLSSSFMKPQFPLDAIEPDLKNVPELALGGEGSMLDDGMESSWSPVETFVDESTVQTSIVVEFVQGIRGYCTAPAVKAIVQLLEGLQPKVGFITIYYSHLQSC